jgi:multiple sugar transport system substrate-binding protein
VTRLAFPAAHFKRLLAISLLVAVLFSACAPGEKTAPAVVQISFMVFGDPAELAAYRSLVDAFHSRSPGVQVALIHIPSQGDYRARLAADLAAGAPADVVLINYRRYAAFAAKGVLEPLGRYLAKSQVIAETGFFSQALEPFRWQGELVCIPQNISSLVVYYNKSLFAQAGLPIPGNDWTWDEFLAAAQALTRDTDGDGATDIFGLGVEPSIFRLAPFIWQNGGELVDDPRTPTRLMLDTPEALEAAQWFVELQTVHHVVPNAAEEASEYSESRFINGRLGMYLNSRRGVPTYREITAFDWDVAALPQKRQAASILHADAYCLPAASQHKDAAWQFIEFANSPDGQALVAASGRTVPSLVSVAESSAFLDPVMKPAHSRIFLDTIPQLRAVPVHANWVDIEEISSEELERAFYGNAPLYEAVLTAIRRCAIYFGENE